MRDRGTEEVKAGNRKSEQTMWTVVRNNYLGQMFHSSLLTIEKTGKGCIGMIFTTFQLSLK